MRHPSAQPFRSAIDKHVGRDGLKIEMIIGGNQGMVDHRGRKSSLASLQQD
jgi:hypothetical protein